MLHKNTSLNVKSIGWRPLPPVHLLHQVCTYQKSCPVEAMRAVNTFRRKSSTVVKNREFTFIF